MKSFTENTICSPSPPFHGSLTPTAASFKFQLLSQPQPTRMEALGPQRPPAPHSPAALPSQAPARLAWDALPFPHLAGSCHLWTLGCGPPRGSLTDRSPPGEGMGRCLEEGPSSGFPSQRWASLCDHHTDSKGCFCPPASSQHLSGQERLGLTVFIFYWVVSKNGNVFSHNSGV